MFGLVMSQDWLACLWKLLCMFFFGFFSTSFFKFHFLLLEVWGLFPPFLVDVFFSAIFRTLIFETFLLLLWAFLQKLSANLRWSGSYSFWKIDTKACSWLHLSLKFTSPMLFFNYSLNVGGVRYFPSFPGWRTLSSHFSDANFWDFFAL